ncbi:putative UDP-glucose flavonoid 3-O-glucosyltransferase 3 [Vitis vinifera]|uniref:Putative UDP-glucose flavonoid 3-O-glucosyltransferase 3 n=1 Tax=Vitis vinifera TaxID=29760 RepID=A0A438FKM8_VITVI|nr:putative UDP-glucose flavonoid 3-O-glucosyltransferase 3 [Vitis vinifera]
MMEKAELVFVPSPAIGHVVASIEIAKLLTRQDDRISVTVLIMKFPSISNIAAKLNHWLLPSPGCPYASLIFLVLKSVWKHRLPPTSSLTWFGPMRCSLASLRISTSLPVPRFWVSCSIFNLFMMMSVDVAEFKGSDADQLEKTILCSSGIQGCAQFMKERNPGFN